MRRAPRLSNSNSIRSNSNSIRSISLSRTIVYNPFMLPTLAQAVIAALPPDQPSIDPFLFDPAESALFGHAPSPVLDAAVQAVRLAEAESPQAEAAELVRFLRSVQSRAASVRATERLAYHRAVVSCAARPECVVAGVTLDTTRSEPWTRWAVGLARTFFREHPGAAEGDEVMFVLADGLRHLGELEEAAVRFEEIPERWPASPAVALAWREAGDCWLAAHDPSSAIGSYLAALGQRADPVYLLYRLAWAHHALGEVDAAIDRMKQAADQARTRRDIGGVLVHQEALDDLSHWAG